jgi:hypothetical protein
MNRRTFLQTIPASLILPSILTQTKTAAVDTLNNINELICKNKFEWAASLNLQKQPIGSIVIEIAKSFIGTDYAADTLEASGEEHLVINLQTLDCVTFYENSLVLARCIKKNKLTFDDYKKELQFIRYRNGTINGYPSRLHYTSDYFYDNEQKDALKDITKAIGGVRFKKKINFMSKHIESYSKLKENPEFIKEIQKIENKINSRSIYHIPKSKVKQAAAKISNGDILGITTNIDGLDCSHTGIAIWQNKELHMIHAPSPGKKVHISEVPLWKYLANVKKMVGVIVARPIEL